MVKIYDFNADYVLYADYKALEAEVERMKKITSVDYLHSVFSRSIQVSKYDGGFGGEFPELDYYIHELQKRALGEHIDEIERLKREQDVTISVNDVLTHQRDAYIRVIEELRAEVERLKVERDSTAQDSEAYRMRIQRLVDGCKQKDADIAALVKALGEYSKAYIDVFFLQRPSYITPASRAVAEKFLKEER